VTHPIHILNASAIDAATFLPIARDVAEIFRRPVDVLHRALDYSGAYDESRGQYNSSIMLARLLEESGINESKIIAVVGVDLYVPVLTFVFGEAQFKGTAAIVSIQRLGNPFYGLPNDDRLLHRRLAKEIVHELGHTFGLYHCRQFECVMRSSTYVEEIDLKKIELCAHCRSLMAPA
jgi:archaemetzincin